MGKERLLGLPYDHTDAEDILRYARRLISRSLSDACGAGITGHGIEGKGNFGQALERHYFLYEPNSDSQPDFPEADLELKTTGLVPSEQGLRAKERLKLNSINFDSLQHEVFDTSTLIEKNRRTLLVCYMYVKGQPVVDRVVRLADIWDIPEDDLAQMETEFNLIREYVRSGRAHELSESLTNYLGACTTGQGKGRDFVPQPCSPIPAKRRAFSFKQPYVTRIIREFEERERRTRDAEVSLVAAPAELEGPGGFERVVLERFEPFLGLSEDEAWSRLDSSIPRPSTANKNRRQWLNTAIIGVPRSKRIEEFDKAGVTMRSFPLRSAGRKPKEDFPFPAFDFNDLVRERWETSALRTRLLNRFLTVFYRLEDAGTYVLVDAVFWGFPEELLDSQVRETWVRTIRRIRQGRWRELPKGSDTGLVFLRTHGRDSQDVAHLPNGVAVPKVSFWIHRNFMQDVFDNRDLYPSRASLLKP